MIWLWHLSGQNVWCIFAFYSTWEGIVSNEIPFASLSGVPLATTIPNYPANSSLPLSSTYKITNIIQSTHQFVFKGNYACFILFYTLWQFWVWVSRYHILLDKGYIISNKHLVMNCQNQYKHDKITNMVYDTDQIKGTKHYL